MNAGERPRPRPPRPPPQLESVRLRSTSSSDWCAAGADRSHSWPSTKPDRRLGPKNPRTTPRQNRGCSCSTELDTSETDRASETLATTTDNQACERDAPRPCSAHPAPQGTRSSGEQRGTTVKRAEPAEATPRSFTQVNNETALRSSQLPKLRAQPPSPRISRQGLLWSTAPTAW